VLRPALPEALLGDLFTGSAFCSAPSDSAPAGVVAAHRSTSPKSGGAALAALPASEVFRFGAVDDRL
jgi:hypothetical protein